MLITPSYIRSYPFIEQAEVLRPAGHPALPGAGVRGRRQRELGADAYGPAEAAGPLPGRRVATRHWERPGPRAGLGSLVSGPGSGCKHGASV